MTAQAFFPIFFSEKNPHLNAAEYTNFQCRLSEQNKQRPRRKQLNQ